MPRASVKQTVSGLKATLGRVLVNPHKRAIITEAISIVEKDLATPDFCMETLKRSAYSAGSQMEALRLMASAYNGRIGVNAGARAILDCGLSKSASLNALRASLWNRLDRHPDWEYDEPGVFRYIGYEPMTSELIPVENDLATVVEGLNDITTALHKIADENGGTVKTSEAAKAIHKAQVGNTKDLASTFAGVHTRLTRLSQKGTWTKTDRGTYQRIVAEPTLWDWQVNRRS